MIRRLKIALLATTAAAMLTSGVASGYSIFFGEDTGLGESTPLPVASRINSTAAQNAFLANLVGVGTETFESFGAGTGAPLNLTFPGAGTATLGGSGSIRNVTPGTTNGVGRYAISGSRFWEASSGSFTITFSDPVAAFGFWGVDIGDFNGRVTLTLQGGSVVNLTVPNTLNIAGGSVLYYGLIASGAGELFTSITFGNTNPGTDFFAFDDMTIGSLEQVRPPPEPGTLALVGLAAALAGAAARARRRA
jgi:hypothetical protein